MKVSGAFQSLPLANSRVVTADSDIVTVGLDPKSHGQFNPKVARGKVSALLGFRADPRQFSMEPHVSFSFEGAAIVNNRAQVVGMILPDPDEAPSTGGKTNTTLTTSFGLKSDHVIAFLRTVPQVKTVIDETARDEKLKPEQVIAKARAATALILVL